MQAPTPSHAAGNLRAYPLEYQADIEPFWEKPLARKRPDASRNFISCSTRMPRRQTLRLLTRKKKSKYRKTFNNKYMQ